MKGPLIGFLLAASSLFLSPYPGVAAAAAPQSPLKVIVMVGQSNMQGHGYMDRTDDDGNFRNGTLEWMVEQDPAKYGKLKTPDPNGGSGNAT